MGLRTSPPQGDLFVKRSRSCSTPEHYPASAARNFRTGNGTSIHIAGSGINAKLLGTVRRTDGTTQVTYAGHPVYRFTKDKKAFQITCQNVSQFGAKWLVVTPAGKAVH